MANETMRVAIKGHVRIKDETNNIILLDQDNAIHPQNMSRIIARALANESNSIIKRVAFGNGGTFKDLGDNLVFNIPNDGIISGWESRLYNETYSEIVDESDPDFGEDLGSAGPNVVRTGGGSDSSSDPASGGVTSVEAGVKSNVTVKVFLNENEPSGQDVTITDPTGSEIFTFDEIGLYSPGKDAVDAPGYTSINVGDKTSADTIANLAKNTTYKLDLIINGVDYALTLTTPSNKNSFTYGDLCEGFNNGYTTNYGWFATGSDVSISNTAGDSLTKVYMYITDYSGYTSITGANSYGFLTFSTYETGVFGDGDTPVSVEVKCSNASNDLARILAANICAKCNVLQSDGSLAGVANDTAITANERERLLTHLIFTPIPKARDVALSIEYTLTVSGYSTSDAIVEIL